MYKIISDSSCDLKKDEIVDLNVSYVPFKITIDGKEYVDDNDFEIGDFLKNMQASLNPIKTSCPAPYEFMEEIEKNKDRDIYIVTITSKLSGSYNAAQVAVEDARQKFPGIKIGLIDSKTASGGQTGVVLKLLDLLKETEDFDTVMKGITDFVNEQTTLFVLESMQNLIKNGRIKKSAGLIANVLNIRPIMGTKDGEIELYEMNRGMKKSLEKLALALEKITNKKSFDRICISHVNAKERAEKLAKRFKDLYEVNEIVIRHTNGLSAGYADIGGIVIGF
ncbi:DegV family protein [Peptoniphilus raoultii]|uniref:DegV family protein n=1 Tax=Peptoniphilus raoultii TaxID=1776387 RepID=UPI0008DB3106|nr:DegV family protein [Peptoniphilus raoultii]